MRVAKKSSIKFSKLKSSAMSNLRINTKLMVVLIVLSILPLSIIGFSTYFQAKHAISYEVGNFSGELIKQIGENINLKLLAIEDSATLVFSNKEIQRFLSKSKYEDQFEKLKEESQIEDILRGVHIANSDISGITVHKDGELKFSMGDISEVFVELFKERGLYQEIIKSEKGYMWIADLDPEYKQLYLAHSIRSVASTKIIGVVVMAINTEVFSNIFNTLTLSEETNLLLMNELGEIFWGSSQESIGTYVKDKYSSTNDDEKESGVFSLDNNIVSYARVDNRWNVILEVPERILMQRMDVVRKTSLGYGILCAICTILISVIISRSIASPIQKLMKLMKRAERGDLTVYSTIDNMSEIGQLSISFNKMVNNIKQLINDSKIMGESVMLDTALTSELIQKNSIISNEISVAIEAIANGTNEQAKMLRAQWRLCGVYQKEFKKFHIV